MKRSVVTVLMALTMLSTTRHVSAQRVDEPQWADYGAYVSAYEARKDSIIQFYANQIPSDDLTRGGYIQIAARLTAEQDSAWVAARIDSLLSAKPRGDMFWMFPFVTAWFAGKDHLPAETLARMRDRWRTYMPYRGDTENHWALYYATLYLMTEQFPDDGPDQWFNGKSSEENRVEAADYLRAWAHLTFTIGKGEYDSPHYLKVYLTPTVLLAAYAEDPEMRQLGEIMLEYTLADWLVENVGGLYGGAHSRVYEREAIEPAKTAASAFGWLLLGQGPQRPTGESYIFAQTGYLLPDILYRIATDRRAAYTQYERKRTRHRIRHSDVANQQVFKTSHVRYEYILGSSQGGLLQPIQQQSWSLLWREDNPTGIHNSLFTVHPYSSAREGTMYFAEPFHMVTELIVRSKREYDSPDKWTGGSPYEHIYQFEDALFALYDIPSSDRHPFVNGFFSKDLSDLKETDSGWIIARGGESYIGFYPLGRYDWEETDLGDRRWRGQSGQNGAVVQAAPMRAFASFEDFEAALADRIPMIRPEAFEVIYQDLAGNDLRATYGQGLRVNGVDQSYETWPLFDGPYLRALNGIDDQTLRTTSTSSADEAYEMEPFILEMQHGRQIRRLDLSTLTIQEEVRP